MAKDIVAYLPQSLDEVLEIINREETIILSGGTDLMVRRRRTSGLIPDFDRNTVFISGLKELKELYRDKSCLSIGAGCTFESIRGNSLVPQCFKDVIGEIASPAIRNTATIGGNICNASPAADILPLLYALEGELVLKSLKKERIVPIEDFITAPGKNILNKNEILKEIKVPLADFDKYHYRKVSARKAAAIAKAVFISFVKVENNIVKDIRISFGAVAPTIIKSKKIEGKLAGKNIKAVKLIKEDIIKEYLKLLNPIDDQRSNKEYRKQISINLLSSFLDSIN